MAEQRIEFGVLNIVAQPHGEGTYRDILSRAAGQEINFWGDLNAAIREPREVEKGVFQSEIVIGTEINLSEPLIDRDSLREVPASETDVRISDAHLYNGRVFLYTFIEETHLLSFESLNEFGKTLSPSRARRIFSRLFSVDVLGPDAPHVDVTVVPEDDTLERLLGLERLDRVEIHLRKPNPADVNEQEVHEILGELEDQGAKSQDISLVRAPGAPRIVLNVQNFIRAKVAQFNGYVNAAGVENGERYSGSTRTYPKVIRIVRDTSTSITAVAVNVAKRIRLGQQPPADGD